MTRAALVASPLVFLLLCASRPAAGGEAIEHVMAATFRVYSGNTSGTGFIVAVPPKKGDRASKDGEAADRLNHAASTRPAKPRLVLVSAAHHFEKMPGDEATVVLRAKLKDGTYERREVGVPIRREKKVLWTKHPDMDVAALPIELPDGVEVRPIDYAQLADEQWAADGKLAAGGEVWVPCFPSGLEGTSGGWPVLRRVSVASHPLAPLKAAKTILIDYPNFGGDSGAPVFGVDGTRPVVVSIVLGMHRQTDTVSTPFEERTTHMPLGLSYAAQAPYIRQTIDLLMAP